MAEADRKPPITWAVVEPADECDRPSVCAFEGDPADGIMADVICEVTSLDEEGDARLISAAPDLLSAATAAIAINDRITTAMLECDTDAGAMEIARRGADEFSEALKPLRAAIAKATAAA